MTTASGGTPYGASHWAGLDGARALTEDSRALAIALGGGWRKPRTACGQPQ